MTRPFHVSLLGGQAAVFVISVINHIQRTVYHLAVDIANIALGAMKLRRATYEWFIIDGYMWDWLTAAALIIINHFVSCNSICHAVVVHILVVLHMF